MSLIIEMYKMKKKKSADVNRYNYR